MNDQPCFSGVGIDYTGSLFCKNVFFNDSLDEDDLSKCYIVIYTCAATRGIVLDLVPDASSQTFINSFINFISRRGCPQIVLSDNGSPFTANNTQQFVDNHNIQWKFSIAEALRYGGFWERLISQVKRCLKKTLGKTSFDFYELQTVLSQIELILNSRPLGVLFDDDLEQILTPNHLLFGRKLNLVNSSSTHPVKEIDISRHYKYVECLLEHFWKRWRT